MGKTQLQHTYDAKVSAGATFQGRCSLPGDRKVIRGWKSLKSCMLLIQKSEGTGQSESVHIRPIS